MYTSTCFALVSDSSSLRMLSASYLHTIKPSQKRNKEEGSLFVRGFEVHLSIFSSRPLYLARSSS
jgi:hypothetical protein